MKRKARVTRKQKRTFKAGKAYPEKYAFALQAAKVRFPQDKVFGEVLDEGTGFSITINRAGALHRIRLRTLLSVNGRRVVSDFIDEPKKNQATRLSEAFDAAEKAMTDFERRKVAATPGGQ